MNTATFYDFTINYHIDEELSNQLLPIAERFLNDKTKLTNAWDYKNTYSIDEGLSAEPELSFFVNYILKVSESYLQQRNLKIKDNFKLWISMFTSEMTMDDEHTTHDHPGALLSGLIYLKTPPGSSKLEFYHPRNTSPAWSKYITETSPHDTELFRIKDGFRIEVNPRPGLFLFWESWAKHRVPPNQSSKGRTTMVFNVGVKDV